MDISEFFFTRTYLPSAKAAEGGAAASPAAIYSIYSDLLREIFGAEKLDAVFDHCLIVPGGNAGRQPVGVIARVVLDQRVKVAAVAELDVIGRCGGVGSHAEVGELAGIDVVAFIDVQAADRLHAGIVIGVGEKLIAVGVIAPDNGGRGGQGKYRPSAGCHGRPAQKGTGAIAHGDADKLLWDKMSQSRVWGRLPNKRFCSPAGCKNSKCGYTCPACR